VNAEGINPVDNESDYQALLEQLALVKSGRHFFNPMPEALRIDMPGEQHG
jgi:hypothetical protein